MGDEEKTENPNDLKNAGPNEDEVDQQKGPP